MDKLFYRYMNTAGILDRTVYIFKKSFLQHFVSSILVTIVSAVIGFFSLVGFLLLIGMGGAFSIINFNTDSGVYISIIVTVAIAILIFMGFASSGLLSANISLSKNVFYGESPNLSNAFSVALKSMPRVFTVLVAQFIVYSLVTAVFALITYLYTTTLASSYYSIYNVFSDSAFLIGLLIILLIYLFVTLLISTAFSVSIPISILEKRYFFGAIIRSFTLVKSSFFKILGTLLIFTIILYTGYYSIAIIFNITEGLLGFTQDLARNSSTPYEQLALLYPILIFRLFLSKLIDILVQPFFPILQSVIFFNQKIKLEGLDIEISAEKLRQNT